MKQESCCITETTAGADEIESVALMLSSRELFRNAKTVCIEHNGEHYCLRLTRGNKLILTK